jgi:hypothetical protein
MAERCAEVIVAETGADLSIFPSNGSAGRIK